MEGKLMAEDGTVVAAASTTARVLDAARALS
jgi:hypothetical protein